MGAGLVASLDSARGGSLSRGSGLALPLSGMMSHTENDAISVISARTEPRAPS